MMETFRRSIGAGMMVGLASIVFVSVGGGIPGAVLFCSALYFICLIGMDLFTGKIGWLGRDGSPLTYYLTVLAGNIVGSGLVCMIAVTANPEIVEKAGTLIAGKMTTPYIAQAAKAIGCGILMYLAVKSFKTGEGIVRYFGIFFAVPMFILSGFEHSIADAGYMFLALNFAFIPRLLLIAFFNGVGSVLAAFFLESAWKKKED